MANKARGDVEFETVGRIFRLRLTLGALAEIEDGLSLDDLSQIEERLKKLRAADLAIVAAALMRGAGHDIAAVDVLKMPVDLRALVEAVTAAFSAASEGAQGSAASNDPFGPASSKPASA